MLAQGHAVTHSENFRAAVIAALNQALPIAQTSKRKTVGPNFFSPDIEQFSSREISSVQVGAGGCSVTRHHLLAPG